jgi:beta-glucanase (GH16 family)
MGTRSARRFLLQILTTLPYITLILLPGCKKEGGGNTGTGGTKPTLSISPVTRDEGTGGNTAFAFDLSLSNSYGQAVTVEVSTTDGTALSSEDYAAVSKQVVTIPAGQTKAVITVNVVGDEWKESTEDFFVLLDNPVNCTLSGTAAKGYITNDDTRILINDKGTNVSPLSYPGYSLVWADEFNGSTMDMGSWNYNVGDGCPNCGWGNNELEYYTAGENLYLQDGKMIIEARSESKGGKNYTSTRLTTQNKKTFKFGRIDIRAKLPRGRGIWPAFWMLGNNISSVSWPKCGEMDIMELLGHEPAKVYSTVHYGPGPGSIQISRSKTAAVPYSDDFHLYSLIWETDRMQFMVDNEVISDVRKADLGSNNYPFNEPFFLLINVAVGGNWPGSPDATTRLPQWMMVDYVRVFQ